MRALLIDPSQNIDNFIVEIDLDSWKDITPAIGGPCNCFTSVSTDLLGNNTGYVDDEGLYNGQMTEVGAFYVKDYPNPLAGRCVVQGIDWDSGESTDCDLSIEEAYKIFGYPTPFGPIYEYKRGGEE
jgi:hypothetical protein